MFHKSNQEKWPCKYNCCKVAARLQGEPLVLAIDIRTAFRLSFPFPSLYQHTRTPTNNRGFRPTTYNCFLCSIKCFGSLDLPFTQAIRLRAPFLSKPGKSSASLRPSCPPTTLSGLHSLPLTHTAQNRCRPPENSTTPANCRLFD